MERLGAIGSAKSEYCVVGAFSATESLLVAFTDEELSIFFPSNAMISLADLFTTGPLAPNLKGISGNGNDFCASVLVLKKLTGHAKLWETEEDDSSPTVVLASRPNWFHIGFSPCPAFWSLPQAGIAPPGG